MIPTVMFRVRFQHLLLRPSIWYWCEEEKWSVYLFTIFFLFAVHFFFHAYESYIFSSCWIFFSILLLI